MSAFGDRGDLPWFCWGLLQSMVRCLNTASSPHSSTGVASTSRTWAHAILGQQVYLHVRNKEDLGALPLRLAECDDLQYIGSQLELLMEHIGARANKEHALLLQRGEGRLQGRKPCPVCGDQTMLIVAACVCTQAHRGCTHTCMRTHRGQRHHADEARAAGPPCGLHALLPTGCLLPCLACSTQGYKAPMDVQGQCAA